MESATLGGLVFARMLGFGLGRLDTRIASDRKSFDFTKDFYCQRRGR